MKIFQPDRDFAQGILVDRPGLLTKTRRFTEWSISVLSWTLWFFALRPLLLLALWAVAGQTIYLHMISKGGVHNTNYFGIGISLVLGILLAIYCWNTYDRWRYRGRYKGRSKGIANDVYMGAFYQTPASDVARVKAARRVDVHFLADHRVEMALEGGGAVGALYNPQRLDLHFEGLRTLRREEERRPAGAPRLDPAPAPEEPGTEPAPTGPNVKNASRPTARRPAGSAGARKGRKRETLQS